MGKTQIALGPFAVDSPPKKLPSAIRFREPNSFSCAHAAINHLSNITFQGIAIDIKVLHFLCSTGSSVRWTGPKNTWKIQYQLQELFQTESFKSSWEVHFVRLREKVQ